MGSDITSPLPRGRPTQSPLPMPMPIRTTTIADFMEDTAMAMATLVMDMVMDMDMDTIDHIPTTAITDARRGALNQQLTLRLTPTRKPIHGTTTADSMDIMDTPDTDTMATDTDTDITDTMATDPTTVATMDTTEDKLWSELEQNTT